MKRKQETYEMIFVSLASDIPVEIRLRHVLKGLLRRYQFRCRSIKPIAPKAKRAASNHKHKNMGRVVVHHGAAERRATPQ